ncbi:hypothetical protein C1645_787689, partial [Glomus cerebriforme]
MGRLLNSFTLLCKEYNPHNKFVWDTSTCVCDFRINIHGCPEEEILKIANWVLIPYYLLLSIVSSICLYHLIYVKKQPFFLPARKDRGILRPRLQHTCYALALIYCPWQIIHILQLVNDLYPNVAWAEIFQILPRTLIASFSVLYPLSILYSTGAIEIDTTLSLMESKRSRNLLKIDVMCISMMIFPIIFFLPLAGLTGHYADIGNIEKANQYFIAQNIFWVIWGICYIGSMIYFWSKFIPKILKNVEVLILNNNKKNHELESELNHFLQNRDNMTTPNIWKIIPASIYLLILFLYVIFRRTNIIFIYGINLTFIIIWLYGIPIIIHIIQWVVIYNTHVASRIPPNGKKIRNSSNNNNGHHRNTIIGLGCGIDERSDMISLAYHVPLSKGTDSVGENYRYSMKISNYNTNNNSPTHKKDSFHSLYDVDIKSKKAEGSKGSSGGSPNYQRHSFSSVPNNTSNHGYRSSSASNIKLVKKNHKSSSSIVN